MSIRDRGMKKWHGFFMPEHSGELRNIWHEDQKIKMPVLDEYQLQEFERILHYALDCQIPVNLDFYADGFIEKKEGVVHRLDQLNQEISLKCEDDDLVIINFCDIMKISTNE